MNRKIIAIVLAFTVGAIGYATNTMAQTYARADIKNAEGKTVGTASLRDTKDGVLITLNVKGLPEGLHAVHVHAVGKCEGPAFTTAGGHFNPMNKKHRLKNTDGPHAGDLPDMYVNKDGIGRYESLLESFTLAPGQTSILDADGSTLVIHASPDDNISDPSGNSGDRIACGVITQAAARKK